MVRAATFGDIPRLVHLGQDFYNSTPLARFVPYDHDSTRQFLWSLLHSAESVVYVAERSGVIVGGIGGTVLPLHWNRSHTLAQQLFLYLDPDHRGTAALGLMRAWENWAAGKGVSVIFSGYKHTDQLGNTQKFLEITGYEPLETTTIKGGATCPQQ